MKIEIVSTGTELLLGEIINTNFQYLAQKLNELGFDVLYETTVGDNCDRMKNVIQTAINRADIVITIGGLGPTQGDITKEVCASLLGRKLVIDQMAQRKIQDFFAKRNLCMPDNNYKQALVPENCIVLQNDNGTAPGVFLQHEKGTIINLPGPPRELELMFENELEPLLKEKFGNQGVIFSKTLRLLDIGESTVAEKLYDLIKNQTNPTIAIYARDGEIIIRLTAKANSKSEAQSLIANVEKQVVALIPNIYGYDDDSIASVLGSFLQKNNLTISLAESCTSGLASSMIADIAGSSNYFIGSVVSYSNDVKTDIINVDKDNIDSLGAVSDKVAMQMAKGVSSLLKTDVGIGITGIAGPGGGSSEKPVGTVYISTFYKDNYKTHKCFFTGSRKQIKLRSAKMALYYTLKFLKTIKEEN